MRKILSYQEFVNEGIFTDFGKNIKKVGEKIKNIFVRMITRGDKAGVPAAVSFDPNNGSIEKQLLDFFKNTEYGKAKLQRNSISESLDLDEAKVPLSWPKSDDVLNYNEPELKEEIKIRLRKVLKEGDKGNLQGVLDVKPIFIFGAPGIGKTQIVAQICDEVGMELYGKPLNLKFVDGEFAEPVDFAGVPSVVEIEKPSPEYPYGKGVTRSNVSVNLLPADNGTDNMGGIIFIDELNRMPREVIKVFMKLVQSRRLGENYMIPLKWYIVAAGNRPEDDPRGGIQDLGTALRDRFSVVNFVPTIRDWKNFINKGRLKEIVIPELIDFLEFQEDYFHNLDPSKQLIKYPTPRAWVDASFGLKRVMEDLERKGITEISEDKLLKIFQMEVGHEAAAAFVDFYKIAKEIPVKDLMLPFTDPDRAPLPDEKKDPKSGKSRPDYAHALLSAIVRKSKDHKLTNIEVCNFSRYLMRVNSPEWGNAAISNLIREHPYLKKDAKAIECIAPLADKWGAELGIKF